MRYTILYHNLSFFLYHNISNNIQSHRRICFIILSVFSTSHDVFFCPFSLSIIICFVWWNFGSLRILYLLSPVFLLHTVTSSMLISSSSSPPPPFPLLPLSLFLHCTSFTSFSLAAFVCCLRVWLCPPLRLSHSLSISIPLCPFISGRGALGACDSAPN